ncbi:tyrosine-type recombinase/integrase [Vibrio maritimus]|uniref:tyrosine-type recombinase/integrase n=1 Tax=Vibrio maritimus TaxID=990268 RepID=UPI004068EFF5
MNNIGRVVSFRSKLGNRDIGIVDDNYIPICPFLVAYLDTFTTLNTKKSYANQLLFIHRYLQKESIYLPHRVLNGEYLTIEEYDKLLRHCKFKRSSFLDNESNVSSFTRFKGKRLDKLIYGTKLSNEKVNNSTFKLRLTLLIEYIGHLHYLHYTDSNFDTRTQKSFETLIEKIKRDRKSAKDENTIVSDPFASVIPDEMLDKCIRFIQPDSKDNPFTYSVRVRNYIIVRLVIESGLRRGAIAKLKLSDVIEHWHNPRIRITKTPNDPDDPRRDIPSQKTKPHVVPISMNLMKLLTGYINNVRSIYLSAQQHEFVFVTGKGSTGDPLTLSGYDYIFSKLGRKMGMNLSIHMFRHKWNERFDDAAEKANVTGQRKEDIRKTAMGWSENSKMGTIYNSKSLIQKAQRIHHEAQSEQIKRNKNDT